MWRSRLDLEGTPHPRRSRPSPAEEQESASPRSSQSAQRTSFSSRVVPVHRPDRGRARATGRTRRRMGEKPHLSGVQQGLGEAAGGGSGASPLLLHPPSSAGRYVHPPPMGSLLRNQASLVGVADRGPHRRNPPAASQLAQEPRLRSSALNPGRSNQCIVGALALCLHCEGMGSEQSPFRALGDRRRYLDGRISAPGPCRSSADPCEGAPTRHCQESTSYRDTHWRMSRSS